MLGVVVRHSIADDEDGGRAERPQVGGSSKSLQRHAQGPKRFRRVEHGVQPLPSASLDWDAVYDSNSNSAVIEDQFLIFDTQDRRFRRYGKTHSGVQWSIRRRPARTPSRCRYVNPGQGFLGARKERVSSGTLTLDPSMIDNDGTRLILSGSAGEEAS